MNNPRANYSVWAQDCYSADWAKLSRQVKEMTRGKCCLCDRQATTTHHAYYTPGGKGDKGGRNLFNLCDDHHREAHLLKRFNRKTHKYSGNWIVIDRNDPIHGRYNDQEFLRRLRRGWAKSVVREPQEFWVWLWAAVILAVLLIR